MRAQPATLHSLFDACRTLAGNFLPVIVVCGEALIDLTSSRTESGRFDAHAGGGPCNTAIGLGRLGVATGFLGRLSNDRFGDGLRAHLASAGVDPSFVVPTDDPTTLAVAHIDERGGASYSFYATGTADPGLTEAMLPTLDDVVVGLHMGTCALAFEPSGQTLESLFIREHSIGRRFLALDPNVRSGVAKNVDAYRSRIVRMISAADLVKVSDADIEALWPGENTRSRAAALASSGPAIVVLTCGGDSLTAFRSNGSSVSVPAEKVKVVDTIGAGDTTNAAMLSWLLRAGSLSRASVEALADHEVASMLQFAAKAAAVTCGRAGANPPWASELDI